MHLAKHFDLKFYDLFSEISVGIVYGTGYIIKKKEIIFYLMRFPKDETGTGNQH